VYRVAGDRSLARQFLHAARLAVPYPFCGEPVEGESPLNDDLGATLARPRQ
jgi:hypothetical protein